MTILAFSVVALATSAAPSLDAKDEAMYGATLKTSIASGMGEARDASDPALSEAASEAQRQVLSNLFDRARLASPEVRLAAHAVNEASAARMGATVPLPSNPRLSGNLQRVAVSRPRDDNTPLWGYGVGLDAVFEITGAGYRRLAEADARVALAKTDLTFAVARATARAWRAWVGLEIANQRGAAADEAVALSQRLAEAVRVRTNVGASAGPDLEAAKLEVATTQGMKQEANFERVSAELELRSAIDLTTADALPPVASVVVLPEPAAPTTLVERALEKRPELLLSAQRLKFYEVAESRLVREAHPKLGASLAYDQPPASASYGIAGLSIELPVAQRNQGPLAIIRAQRETERERYAILRRQVEREVVLTRERYEAQRLRLSIIENDALPAAQRNRQLVEDGWRAGRFDVFRLMNSARELNRVRSERLQVLRSAWDEMIELERLSGGLGQ